MSGTAGPTIPRLLLLRWRRVSCSQEILKYFRQKGASVMLVFSPGGDVAEAGRGWGIQLVQEPAGLVVNGEMVPGAADVEKQIALLGEITEPGGTVIADERGRGG